MYSLCVADAGRIGYIALSVFVCVAGVALTAREMVRRRKLTPEERRLEDEEREEEGFYW
jgi:hypothetical protein